LPRSDRLEEAARARPDEARRAAEEVSKRLFRPHSGGQLAVMQSNARFRTIAAGRRWGKTKLGAHEILKYARKPDSMNWWVANTYKNVRRGYREIVRQTPPRMLAKSPPMDTSQNLALHFKNGATIEFYSAERPDSMAGEGNDFVLVDEGGLIKDIVWQQIIRPTLMDKRGDALIISTPRGHNWFWKIWKRGLEGKPGYESWRFAQITNPIIDPQETAEAKEELPELLFRQEIMAEFLASGASIFGLGIETPGAVRSNIVAPAGHVFLGVDLAKQYDYTVLDGARSADRLPCYHERFNGLSWPTQREKINNAVAAILADGAEAVTVMLDATGIGDPMHDNLVEDELDVIPIKFTSAWKEAAVKLLAADMEQHRAHIIEEQRPEFESYEYSVTDGGKYKFEAATGHDDEVSAALLRHWGMIHEGPPSIETFSPAAERAAAEAAMTQALQTQSVVPDAVQDIMSRTEVWNT
jgi:Terminase large subunit, T4likevirus-type, N-terminal